MRPVFISYSRSDVRRADQLAAVLEKEGMPVSKEDALFLRGDWQAEILSAIKRCSAFVAFIDEQTPNVMLELGCALGAAKPVLLIAGHNARIPFDVASLPVLQFDEGDTGALFAIAEHLRSISKSDAQPDHQFPNLREHLVKMATDSDYLEHVTAMQFESYILRFLQQLGFETVQTSRTQDVGYDMLIRYPSASFEAAVEVRKYTRNGVVGVSVVRQLLGALMVSEIPCAILISTNPFSESAQSMAQKAPARIVLMTLDELLDSTGERIVLNVKR
jgi:hypothetical protein